MKEQLIGEARCGESHVSYYLLEDGPSYGIRVALEGEMAVVRALSPSRSRVEALAEGLVRGAVTPVALRDVVDDWLLE